MRCLVLLFLAVFPCASYAVEMPAGQKSIDRERVLRGNFTHEMKAPALKDPWRTSGHFVVAPATGLIWGVDKPFPTATVVTPEQATQQIGSMNVKLPIKNLRSLYDVVSAALAKDWSKLEKDFIIKHSINNERWNMLLTPRIADKPKLPYMHIEVSGSAFVEKILMTKADGGYDAIDFSDEVLSSAPLTDAEKAIFNKVKL